MRLTGLDVPLVRSRETRVDMESPAKAIDHTLLKADCIEADIHRLCEEAVEFGFASVCVPPSRVILANRLLYGSEVKVCTVVGFPLGYQTTESKVFETRQATDSGAAEIDMVIPIGAAREADYARVGDDIRRVITAAGEALVKVIIECCLFTDDEKRKLAMLVADAGAAYVKTSTGFASGGATLADVRLLADAVDGRALVKAAGGIRDWACCAEMLKAGAARIGTSAGVEIIQQWQREVGLRCP